MKGRLVDYGKMDKDVNEILDQLHCKFRSQDLVSSLTSGEMQMLAIARALYHHSNIISLDEPTASLTLRETAALMEETAKRLEFLSHKELTETCQKALKRMTIEEGRIRIFPAAAQL